MQKLSKYFFLILLGIASWLPVVIVNFYFTVTALKTGWEIPPLPKYFLDLIYTIFFLANGFMIQQIIRKIEKWDVIDLFWKLLVIGISGLSITFLFQIVVKFMEDDILYPHVYSISMSVNLYALTIFLMSGIFIFRKLILYQKNKRKLYTWRAFEIMLLLAFGRIFMVSEWEITQIYQSIILPSFLVLSLLLSANVNWSAYLNFQQKLKTLFLIFIILLLFVAFYFTFPFDALIPRIQGLFELMVNGHMVLGLLFLFPLIYALFSGLVLIFNLPTSSVFEQRSSELASIQQINQSIQSNLDVKEILKTLLDGSLLTSNAGAGWIESVSDNGEVMESEIPFLENIEQKEIKALTQVVDITNNVLQDNKILSH